MTYATEKVRLGREKFTIVELDLDYCSNTYGGGLDSPLNGTCTAAGAAGSECYNTRFTCQDSTNFTKTTKTYKFCSNNPPAGVAMIPALVADPKFVPTEIKPDKGISLRSTVSIQVKDGPHHDRGVDPYISTRTTPSGTYFGRLLARNPYYRGRLMRVKTGYIGQSGFSEADFNTKLYIIETIKGPIRRGDDLIYTIEGKDLLGFADNKKLEIPAPSDIKLATAVDASATTFVLTADSDASDLPASNGAFAIGDEWCTYTTKAAGDSPVTYYQLTGVSRAQYGTTADSHDVDDSLQKIVTFTGTPVQVINDILTTYAGISSSYIPFTDGSPEDEWDIEQNYWFPGINLSASFGDPKGAHDLLSNLCEAFQIDLWWDEVNQKIKLKANVPPLTTQTVSSLTDDDFVQGSVEVREAPDKRVSRVIFRFDKIDRSGDDEPSNFAKHYYTVDANAESVNTYDEIQSRIVKSEWLSASETNTAIQTSQRLLIRFAETPKIIKFKLDAKDSSFKTGDLVDITTRFLQDVDGTDKTTRFQIIKHKETEQGHEYEYEALSFYFNKRMGFVASNSLEATSPITTYSLATDDEKTNNAFISNDDGSDFSDGGSAYFIV